jgi:hypothetical protein
MVLTCLEREVLRKTGDEYARIYRQIHPKDQTSHFCIIYSFIYASPLLILLSISGG